MADHVSSLVLDSMAAGLPVEAGQQAHVAECPECGAAVVARKAASAAFLERPEARRRLGVLQSQVIVANERPSRPWLKVLAFALSLAAVLGVVVRVVAVPGGDRVKGSAAVMVLLDGGQVSAAPVGSHVTVALGSAGAAYGAVLSIDSNGDVDIVWPAKGDVSGRLEGGASERLAEFEVTPGSLTLRAFLTDEAVSLEALARDGGVSGARVVETRLDVTP